VRHSDKEVGIDTDGVTYHFSARLQGRGDLSGYIYSPEDELKTGQLAWLAETLAEFARDTIPLAKLETRLAAAEKSIVPAAR
jgi:hypothetical protein